MNGESKLKVLRAVVALKKFTAGEVMGVTGLDRAQVHPQIARLLAAEFIEYDTDHVEGADAPRPAHRPIRHYRLNREGEHRRKAFAEIRSARVALGEDPLAQRLAVIQGRLDELERLFTGFRSKEIDISRAQNAEYEAGLRGIGDALDEAILEFEIEDESLGQGINKLRGLHERLYSELSALSLHSLATPSGRQRGTRIRDLQEERPTAIAETSDVLKRGEPPRSLRINQTAPDFTAETTQGMIRFHEWMGVGWAILFSLTKEFNPVSTTELGYMAGLQPEFAKRDCKIIGLSADIVSSHSKWAVDVEEMQGHKVTFPIVADPKLRIAKLYGILPSASEPMLGRAAAINATVLFIIGPDKKIKLMLSYPMTSGRNFDEVLRVLDSIQLTAKHKVATPANWKPGDDVIIPPSVSEEQARQMFSAGWKAPKPYLRVVPQPKK